MAEEGATPDLVELSRRAVDAVNRRDFDAIMSFVATDVVVDAIGTFAGHAAIRGYFEEWTAAFEEFRLNVEEIRDLGNGVTIAMAIVTGRPSDSTGWLRFRYALVSTSTDGLIERQTRYTDIDNARAVAERLAEERR